MGPAHSFIGGAINPRWISTAVVDPKHGQVENIGVGGVDRDIGAETRERSLP